MRGVRRGLGVVGSIGLTLTLTIMLACTRQELADEADESTPPSAESAPQPSASKPASVATSAVATHAPATSAGDGDYQTIRARTIKGEATDLSIKAPSGWKVVAAPTSPDPHAGKFTLAEATNGLPKQGTLVVRIETSLGSFYCDLFDDEAPNTVANFVGLARGLRKYWDSQELAWVARPYYDGTTFHRVVPGFMIQGGDRSGTGSGHIGYFIPDELHPALTHDRPGQLCMSNRGANTNSSQFFITEVPAPHIDGRFGIFGQCEPWTLVQRISRVPQSQARRPDAPVVMTKVEIRRVLGGAAKWRPKGDEVPPLPGLPAPGRAVMVPVTKP